MLHTKRKKEIFFLILTLVFSVGFAYIKSTLAAPDAELTYHGKLTDTSNVAVPDGTYDFTLVIYDAPTGGNCLWSAQGNCTTPTAKALTLTNGIFSTTLGESGDNPLNLDFSQNYYLGVTIGTNSEMTPRRKITPTGFALNSHRLNGLTADNYIDTSATAQTKAGSLTVNDDFTVNTNDLFVDTSTGRVGVGTISPTTALDIHGDIQSENISVTGTLPSDVWGQVIGLGTSGAGSTTQGIIGHQAAHELDIFWNFYRENATSTYVGLSANGYTSANGIRMGNTGIVFVGTPTMGTTIPDTKMIIGNNGNVGIGSITPNYKLQVDGDIVPETDDTYTLGTSTLRWQDLYLGPNSLHIGTDGDEGTISYDTTNDIFNFNTAAIFGNTANAVTGTIRWTGTDFQGYTGSGWLSLTGSAGLISSLWDTDTDTGIQTEEASDEDIIRFDTAGTERLQLTAAGHLLPSTNNTYDLGSTTNRFQDLYLGANTLHIGTSATDEGLISYDTTGNILNFTTDVMTQGDIAFNTNDLYIDTSLSGVGIGTTSPDSGNELHVYGDILAASSPSGNASSRNSGVRLWTDEGFGMELHSGQTGHSAGWATAVYGRASDTTALRFGSYPAASTQQGDFNEYMTILNSGNVGLGTTSPNYPLHLYGTSNGGADIYSQTDGGRSIKHWFANAGRSWSIGQIGTTSSPSYAFNIIDETASESRLAIDIFGNVGIGTTSPDTKLHVNGGDIILSDTDSHPIFFLNGYGTSANPAIIGTRAGGTEISPTATQSGEVLFTLRARGYGTTDYFGPVTGSAQIRMFAEENFTDSTGAASMRFETAASGASSTLPRMTIHANGNVGIGTTSPAYPLHVFASDAAIQLQDSGDANSYTMIDDAWSNQLRINKVTNSGSMQLDINPMPNDGTSSGYLRIFRETDTTGLKALQIFRGNNTTNISAQIGADGNDTYFGIHGGNVGIGTTSPTNFKLQIAGDIGPDTDDAYNLGSSANRFKDLYGQGVVDLGNAVYLNQGSGNVGVGPDINFNARGLITADSDMLFNIDSDNNESDAYFAFSKNANTDAAEEIATITENDINFNQTLNLNNTDALYFEDGKHAITFNDAQGNFNIRVGHYSNPSAVEEVTEAGHPLHIEYTQNSGSLTFNLDTVSRSVGETAVWGTRFYFNEDGNAYKPGGGTWSATSDERLKKNIVDYEDGLDELLAIHPVWYSYNELSGFGDTDKRYVGLIAQEIKDIAPYTVEMQEDEIAGGELMDVYKFDPSALQYMTINAIQEQNTLITQNSNNLTTKATATSLSGLQNLVDTELENIDTLITTNRKEILTLQEDANTLSNILTNIQEDIDLINEEQSTLTSLVSTHNDTIIAINENILFTVNGDERVVTFGGVVVSERIEAKEIIAGKFVTAASAEAATAGTVRICQEDSVWDGEDCVDATDETEFIDGTGVFVETAAITEKSRVMVTPRAPIAVGVVDVKDEKGFELRVDAPVQEDVAIDWFIVDSE